MEHLRRSVSSEPCSDAGRRTTSMEEIPSDLWDDPEIEVEIEPQLLRSRSTGDRNRGSRLADYARTETCKEEKGDSPSGHGRAQRLPPRSGQRARNNSRENGGHLRQSSADSLPRPNSPSEFTLGLLSASRGRARKSGIPSGPARLSWGQQRRTVSIHVRTQSQDIPELTPSPSTCAAFLTPPYEKPLPAFLDGLEEEGQLEYVEADCDAALFEAPTETPSNSIRMRILPRSLPEQLRDKSPPPFSADSPSAAQVTYLSSFAEHRRRVAEAEMQERSEMAGVVCQQGSRRSPLRSSEAASLQDARQSPLRGSASAYQEGNNGRKSLEASRGGVRRSSSGNGEECLGEVGNVAVLHWGGAGEVAGILRQQEAEHERVVPVSS